MDSNRKIEFKSNRIKIDKMKVLVLSGSRFKKLKTRLLSAIQNAKRSNNRKKTTQARYCFPKKSFSKCSRIRLSTTWNCRWPLNKSGSF